MQAFTNFNALVLRLNDIETFRLKLKIKNSIYYFFHQDILILELASEVLQSNSIIHNQSALLI